MTGEANRGRPLPPALPPRPHRPCAKSRDPRTACGTNGKSFARIFRELSARRQAGNLPLSGSQPGRYDPVGAACAAPPSSPLGRIPQAGPATRAPEPLPPVRALAHTRGPRSGKGTAARRLADRGRSSRPEGVFFFAKLPQSQGRRYLLSPLPRMLQENKTHSTPSPNYWAISLTRGLSPWPETYCEMQFG